MGALAGPIAVVSTALDIGGKVAGMQAAGDRARKQRDIAATKAEQYERKAKKTRAASQRMALEERRKADLIASRATALMAASGGTVGPGAGRLIADIENEGAYRQAMAMYEGEESARDYELAAETALETGELGAAESMAKATSYGLSALGTGLEGGASIYEKYKKGIFG